MKILITKEDREYINDILVDLDDCDDLRVHTQDGIIIEWSNAFLPLRLLKSTVIPDKIDAHPCLQICIGTSHRFVVKHQIGYQKFDFYGEFEEKFDKIKSKLEDLISKYDGYKLDVDPSSGSVYFNIISDKKITLTNDDIANESRIVKFSEILHKNTYPKYQSVLRLI
jgi:hypothetical protein